jgi:hypothetical protein
MNNEEIKKPIFNGFDMAKEIAEQSPDDWMFGDSGDTEVKVPDGDWTPFLPSNEKQRQGFESMCCTNFSSTNAVEILFTWMLANNKISAGNLQWLKDKGYFDANGKINFSDRFDAIISGTSPVTGNSLKAPAEGKRKNGLIPESLLPWTDDKTAYFNKNSITQAMYALGQEFLTRFSINYEMVYDAQVGLLVSPLAGACHAWDNPIDGIYQLSNGSINHAICRIKPPANQKVMDSYEPFQKVMADDYIFMNYGIRYIVRDIPQGEPIPNLEKKNMIKTLRADTDNKIYGVSNLNSKELLHLKDEVSWGTFKRMGWVNNKSDADEIISPALLPLYTILNQDVQTPYKLETTNNIFSSLIAWFVGLLTGKGRKK